MPPNNVPRSIQQSQAFYNYNDSSSYTSNSRLLRNLDPELIHNSDYIPSNILIQSNFNPNLTYNTYLSSQNANRSQALFNNTNNSEDRSMISRNSSMTEQQQHRSLSRTTTMSLDDILDLHSSSYQDKDSSWQQNMHNNYKKNDLRSNQRPQHASHSPANSHYTATQQLENNSQELTFSDKQSLVNWLCIWPDLITQVQSLLIESSPNKMEANISEPTNKETIINLVMEQLSKDFKMLGRKTREYFDNFRHIFNKDMTVLAKNFLVKNCDPTDENIEQFIAGKVWRQKLSKFLDASDFSEFKRSQSSLKSLENFIAESLKIHVDYQIAINNKEKLSYSENVLKKIKKLDQLTLHLTIPSASRRNCVNELDLNQISIESSDNE